MVNGFGFVGKRDFDMRMSRAGFIGKRDLNISYC